MVKKIDAKKTKSSPKPKADCARVTAYCLKCRANVVIDSDIELIKKPLPNGNVVTILCGKCSTCQSKVCKIIANNKAK